MSAAALEDQTSPFHDTNSAADVEARSGQSPLSTVTNMDVFRVGEGQKMCFQATVSTQR